MRVRGLRFATILPGDLGQALLFLGLVLIEATLCCFTNIFKALITLQLTIVFRGSLFSSVLQMRKLNLKRFRRLSQEMGRLGGAGVQTQWKRSRPDAVFQGLLAVGHEEGF